MKIFLSPVLVLVLVLVLVATPTAQAQAVHDIEKLLTRFPLGDAPTRMDEVTRTAAASVHLVQTRTEVAPNYHVAHDELVLLWRGTGTLTVAGTPTAIAAGAWCLIPRGTPHAFKADAVGPAVALVVFTPAFDGKDRYEPMAAVTVTVVPSPELNVAAEAMAKALEARDAELLAVASRKDPKASRDHFAALIASFWKRPLAEAELAILRGLPHMDGIPTATARVLLTINGGTGKGAYVATFEAERRGGGWVPVGAFLDPAVRTLPRTDLPATFRPEMFARWDSSELRAPVSGPTLRGFFPTAQRITLRLDFTPKGFKTYGFDRQGDKWVVAE